MSLNLTRNSHNATTRAGLLPAVVWLLLKKVRWEIKWLIGLPGPFLRIMLRYIANCGGLFVAAKFMLGAMAPKGLALVLALALLGYEMLVIFKDDMDDEIERSNKKADHLKEESIRLKEEHNILKIRWHNAL